MNNIAEKIFNVLHYIGVINMVLLLLSFIVFLILLHVCRIKDKKTKISGYVSLSLFISTMIIVIILIILKEKYDLKFLEIQDIYNLLYLKFII